MIEWWGPIIHEYYSGTEGGGLTWITSEQWLAHPGSVGAAVWGAIYICDDEGNVLPVGEDGVVWFGDRENTFVYNNDPEKTKQTFNERGWSTLWDVGHLDEDGFLYLTDRKLFMIVSGGVNIYPQEIEDVSGPASRGGGRRRLRDSGRRNGGAGQSRHPTGARQHGGA